MAEARYRVDFNEKWMQRQSFPGGSIYETTREATDSAVAMIRNTIRSDHVVTGKLGNSFRVDMNRRGRANVFGIIRNTAPYASFFFYGTRKKIKAKNPSGIMGLRDGIDGEVFARRRAVSLSLIHI